MVILELFVIASIVLGLSWCFHSDAVGAWRGERDGVGRSDAGWLGGRRSLGHLDSAWHTFEVLVPR
jgi:hypothetical protein